MEVFYWFGRLGIKHSCMTWSKMSQTPLLCPLWLISPSVIVEHQSTNYKVMRNHLFLILRDIKSLAYRWFQWIKSVQFSKLIAADVEKTHNRVLCHRFGLKWKKLIVTNHWCIYWMGLDFTVMTKRSPHCLFVSLSIFVLVMGVTGWSKVEPGPSSTQMFLILSVNLSTVTRSSHPIHNLWSLHSITATNSKRCWGFFLQPNCCNHKWLWLSCISFPTTLVLPHASLTISTNLIAGLASVVNLKQARWSSRCHSSKRLRVQLIFPLQEQTSASVLSRKDLLQSYNDLMAQSDPGV